MKRPAALLSIGLLSACQAACPEYWKPACEVCGEDTPACAEAKEIGNTLSGDARECTATAASFVAKSKDEAFARRYCNAADNSAGDLTTLAAGPWVCDGVVVEFSEGRFEYGGELHDITALAVSSFRITSGPAYDRRPDDGAIVCEYDLGTQQWSGTEVALALDCPPNVGLPTGWEPCLRQN